MNFFKSPSIPSAARESQTFTKGGGYGGQIEWVAVNARCIPPLLVRLYFRRFLGRIENWSQKSYKNTEIDLDRLGLNQSKKIEAGRSDNEIRIKPQYGQWHQVPFGISSSPHSQRTCQKADA